MKATSPEFATRLASGVTTLCRLWRFTPRGRATLYFTDHDADVVFGGHTYSSSRSFSSSAIQNSIGSSMPNLEVAVVLDTVITRADVERGIYDGGAVEIDAINFLHTDEGTMPLFVGTIKTVAIPQRQLAIMSCGGSSGYMTRRMTEVFSPTCRADFCDARCGLDLDDYDQAFTVDSVSSDILFVASEVAAHPDAYFALGTVTWATGRNAGVSIEVLTSLATGAVTLFMPLPFAPEVGDTGTIYRGCAKTVEACIGYNNLINFRGEPFMPGSTYTGNPSGFTSPSGDAAETPPTLPLDWDLIWR